MNRILAVLTLLAFCAGAQAQQKPATSAAQAFPNRPLRMIIPWPPGQATDLAGRVVGQKLGEILGYQVIADNRPGAGGMIGTELAARATPDGYTILAASSGPVTISPLLIKTPYVPERDLAPVASAGQSPYLLVTAPAFPARDVRDFIAHLKTHAGKYTFASSGTGATSHLVSEYFNHAAGIRAVHVPYKGSVPALTDVISGQVAYMIETAAATMPHVRGGRLKAYGVSLARGSALAPGVPPLATAADLPGFDVGAWIGVMVSTGTPRPLIDRLTSAVDKALQSPDVKEKLTGVGIEVDYRRAEDMGRHLQDQHARFADIIKRANIKVD